MVADFLYRKTMPASVFSQVRVEISTQSYSNFGLRRQPDRSGYDGDGEDEVGSDDQGAAAAVDPPAGQGQGNGGDGEHAVPDRNPQGASEAGAGDDHGGDE